MFRNMVDSIQMQLGNTYRNKLSEVYTIKMFKYYISSVSIEYNDKKITTTKRSHLINEADSASKNFVIKALNKPVTSISFLIGVDSIYNVSGTQTGDLDPAKGMFWTWNSGYIMAKLEATSPQSTAPNNNVTLHIGGFKTGQKTYRKITLTVPPSANSLNQIVIAANANSWFSSSHILKISDHPVCTTPGKLAVDFADNYATGFTLISVK